MKPAIEITDLSKVYYINHEDRTQAGTATLRDALSGLAKKPVELFTGHRSEREQFWALKDINFSVQPGDTLGVIGRNGSGKSTLLKVLSRIVEPTTGQIRMRGKVASLLEVGTGFHPELTGRENIFFNGAILGMSQREIRNKFEEIVEFSEVEQFLDTPVKFYSSGMYVRLAFAVAAHLEPDILIVDEVLAVGDAAFQKKCLGKMKDVAGQGRTVLFVSHSMPSVKSLCEKAIWLDKGVIRAIGDTEAVADQYVASTLETTASLNERPRTTAVSGEARIERITISSENQKGPLLDSKQPMRIEFEISAKQAVKDVIVHCGINANGQMVARFMSEFAPQNFDLKKGRNAIVCTTEPTKLTGGIYSVDCSILHPGREMAGHIDEVFDAATFSVTDYGVPSGDQYLTQREASYYIDHSWRQT